MVSLICFIPVLAFMQDLTIYYEMLAEGRTDIIEKVLPGLQKRYPDNPEILFFSGLVESDGEKSLMIFRDLVSKHPESEKADDSLLKVIEYLYAKGLYKSTVKQCKKMIENYPESELISDCVYFLLCSFNAMAKRDSVDYYYKYYTNLYPEIKINFKPYICISNYILKDKDDMVGELENEIPIQPSNYIEDFNNQDKKDKTTPKYSIQAGAFASISNAYILKEELERKGYDPCIQEIKRGNRVFFAVRLGSFDDKSEAEMFGEKIKREDNYDYIIVEIK